ncbi:MAG TPA: DUF3499 family protein [Microthrixaceae bacterium]|nr:DUF3499 family protein [Microthrixaceae bacterium]HMT26115.1 DUF3499 family protein [Microthrixaceae bacterium]HMT61881.1 DUF3499 family protein [Microthrixaceae bacterium]
MSRTCARPGCNEPAVAVLTMDAAHRRAWFDTVAEDGTGQHPLCERHASRTRLPSGWELTDRRHIDPTDTYLTEPRGHLLRQAFERRGQQRSVLTSPGGQTTPSTASP